MRMASSAAAAAYILWMKDSSLRSILAWTGTLKERPIGAWPSLPKNQSRKSGRSVNGVRIVRSFIGNRAPDPLQDQV